MQSHTNLSPNHRKIPIISGKSGLVKSYPPTLRKVMQDAIQREDLAAGPGVELEKMGNWPRMGELVEFLLGGGSLVFHFCLKPNGFTGLKQTQNPSFGLGRLRSVLEGNWQFKLMIWMYVYIYIALKKINKKYEHAFWCWWLVLWLPKYKVIRRGVWMNFMQTSRPTLPFRCLDGGVSGYVSVGCLACWSHSHTHIAGDEIPL